jgi:hypothetical protein
MTMRLFCRVPRIRVLARSGFSQRRPSFEIASAGKIRPDDGPPLDRLVHCPPQAGHFLDHVVVEEQLLAAGNDLDGSRRTGSPGPCHQTGNYHQEKYETVFGKHRYATQTIPDRPPSRVVLNAVTCHLSSNKDTDRREDTAARQKPPVFRTNDSTAGLGPLVPVEPMSRPQDAAGDDLLKVGHLE